ncbi:hypothetical protein AUM41_13500 [Cronobacter malonaticus]|nr:hypothetical protein [Cronobacter malonaticus]EGT4421835.1 hypothetical protein [Cronobacter malonaticus]EGT4446926.1 hypothetical protein [Cronobacter malonaticus]EGT4455265.1 hypothetical protein [Cronobacter malonaticus]PUX20078.1 hypothetical protein BS413_10290 [Cronobacter malonaticus]
MKPGADADPGGDANVNLRLNLSPNEGVNHKVSGVIRLAYGAKSFFTPQHETLPERFQVLPKR